MSEDPVELLGYSVSLTMYSSLKVIYDDRTGKYEIRYQGTDGSVQTMFLSGDAVAYLIEMVGRIERRKD